VSERTGRVIVVANRLPVRAVEVDGRRQWKTSPGGLVTALAPILRERDGAWIGWDGTSETPGEAFTHDEIRNVPVGLSESDLENFYYGFSNGTLWPLYHDAVRPPEFHRHWWRSYVAINERFAEAVSSSAEPGDVIWVHDYQLQLVPGMVRAMRPGVRVGFFLHIPFPPEELFAQLPWRTQIARGLLGADVVGFQTVLGAQNFARVAKRFTGVSGTNAELLEGGRAVRVGAFPISIDVAKYQALAGDPGVKARAEELRSLLGGRRIILGVDRLDYTKGIDIRLKALAEMFSRGRWTAQECVFVQVAVPSREAVGGYATEREAIEQMVGHVNGDFAAPGSVAVDYLYRNLPIEELAAYYVAADVMLVSPLRDGMNLVAKEYVASRLDDTGVLVLSEFAGAAHELRGAIQVNPHDVDGLASGVEAALEMTDDEAEKRMAAMRRVVRRRDVFTWADEFLRTLSG